MRISPELLKVSDEQNDAKRKAFQALILQMKGSLENEPKGDLPDNVLRDFGNAGEREMIVEILKGGGEPATPKEIDAAEKMSDPYRKYRMELEKE